MAAFAGHCLALADWREWFGAQAEKESENRVNPACFNMVPKRCRTSSSCFTAGQKLATREEQRVRSNAREERKEKMEGAPKLHTSLNTVGTRAKKR